MTGPSLFDQALDRIMAGERLAADDLAQLASAPDILSIGMLADALRRQLHGTRVTFVRVAACPYDQSSADVVPPVAREVRMTGSPSTLEDALSAVRSARAVAGERSVSGFSWLDVARIAAGGSRTTAAVLTDLRAAGLDSLAEVPLDALDDEGAVVEELRRAGFDRLRLTIAGAHASADTARMLRAAALQDRLGGIQAINPLPTALDPLRPTTGYDDAKAVAIARLAAPNIPTIQVDWQRYGPKLAQVALTFGADDLDNVPASDDAPDGRRRAPLEELRRNIEAAGFAAAERDGRFQLVS